ncbi:hypothetical protein [Sulfobacillus thermosulfidooxidans]|uniref:hypothetical protein n=1 Tax=Sulfobacillus thermosulfidooxidans TaxID=28034 RepID=UPI0006B51F01|nr:hypothetical protein [Sulfobacillus thermosulfidooxidans]
MTGTIVLLFCLSVFALVSGFNEGGNLIATFRSSRIIPRRRIAPLLLVAIGMGPVIFGTAVSRTMALEVIHFPWTGSIFLEKA